MSTPTTDTPGQTGRSRELDPTIISPKGDVVLVLDCDTAPPHPQNGTTTNPQPRDPAPSSYMYRVDSDRLQQVSPYFERLLHPTKFGEGSRVAEHHRALAQKYPPTQVVPMDELPRVHIADLGRISPSVKSLQLLMADFLRLLHNQDMAQKLPPLANLANLCVVADRFDAIPPMRQYVHARKLMAALDAKSQDKSGKAWSEERVRQRLLVGLFLDNPAWVWHASLRILHRGWVSSEPDDNAALWWDLPMGIEEELLFRRDCLLETIQSLQTHFLGVYTSRDRQCKLGYDSSGECDVFQLGQMVKFFKRINTLSLQGTVIATADPPEPYDGDLLDLIDKLKQAPEYQIDKNHSHCGIRTRILPLLELVAFSLNHAVGICLQCWQDARHDHAWSMAKRPLVWQHNHSAGAAMLANHKSRHTQTHVSKHTDARDLFMANQRLWTA